MATQVASLYGLLDLRDDGFRRGLGDAERGLDGLATNLKSVGDSLSGLGRSMTTYVTAPIVAGFGLMVNSAMNFDTAMTNAQAILGLTATEAAGLRNEVLAMGGASLAGPQATAEAFYDIVSGVQDASTHMAILDAAIRTSEAGAANLGSTTSAVIAVMNSYGFAADDAAFVSDVFTRTVGMGVMTMEQLASAMPAATQLANTMGIELDTLASFMAYMTTQGATASEASTRLRAAMTTMLNPTTELAKAIEALGFGSGESMVQALGLEGALSAIRDFGGGSFAGLITNQEALLAALSLTTDGATEFFETFVDGVDGATEAARNIQLESLSAQLALIGSKISELAIRIGNFLLPILISLAKQFKPVLDSVLTWIEANPKLVEDIIKITGVLMVLGPIIWLIGKAIGIVAGIITLFSAAWAIATGKVALGTVAIAGVTTPVWAVVGAIAALTAGLVWLANEIGVFQFFGDMVNAARHFMQDPIRGIIEMIMGIVNWIQRAQGAWNSFIAAIGLGGGTGYVGGGYSGNAAANIAAATGAVGGGGTRSTGFGGGGTALRDGRAGGGSVSAGMPYMVGERGREMFIPQTSGRIASTEEVGRGNSGGVQINSLVIHANTYAGGQAAAQGFEDRLQSIRRKRG